MVLGGAISLVWYILKHCSLQSRYMKSGGYLPIRPHSERHTRRAKVVRHKIQVHSHGVGIEIYPRSRYLGAR